MKTKRLEFPSWEEFKTLVLSTGVKGIRISRGHALIIFSHFSTTLKNEDNDYVTHDKFYAKLYMKSIPNEYGNTKNALIKRKEFFYTKQGYNLAIQQLNYWLDELIAELRGIG